MSIPNEVRVLVSGSNASTTHYGHTVALTGSLGRPDVGGGNVPPSDVLPDAA